ncbi:MAG TPA: helix-turn-helix transcriptional regulator [Stellaceae bacterium]|jgi:ribosome-binding protein aMBF1 (putative translation factor)
MSKLKIRFLGLEDVLLEEVIRVALNADSIGAAEDANLVVTTPDALEDMLEDAAATAAFHAAGDQERVPIELVDRLLAGENPVKVWREHRGLSQRALAERVGLNFAYLSQIETGARCGTVATIKKLAEALGLEPSDLI